MPHALADATSNDVRAASRRERAASGIGEVAKSLRRILRLRKRERLRRMRELLILRLEQAKMYKK